MNESVHNSPRLDGLSEVELASVLLDAVQSDAAGIIRGITGEDPGSLDPDRPFRELGLDSLGGVELHRRLTGLTGLSLPVTAVFEYPTPAALAAYLTDRLRGRSPVADVVVPRAVTGAEPLAIIGMSCRYPGDIRSPEDLWRVVADERDVISAFPGDRGWDLASVYDADPDAHGTSYVNRGGFLADAAD